MISAHSEPDAVRERTVPGAGCSSRLREARVFAGNQLENSRLLMDHLQIVEDPAARHADPLPPVDDCTGKADPVFCGSSVHSDHRDEAYNDTMRKLAGVATSRVEVRLDSARRQLERYPDSDYPSRIAALEDLLADRYARLGRPKRVNKKPRVCKPFARWMPTIMLICEKHRVTKRELFSGYKGPRITDCRHEVWWTIHHELGVSFSAIGRRMGGYHHTSVMNGVRKWQARLEGSQLRFDGEKN